MSTSASPFSAFVTRHRFLILFAVLSSLMGTSVGIAKVATSLYAVQLGANESLLGLIAAAQMVGILFVSIPIGILVDNWGPARLFVIGTLLAGTTYVLLPLIPSTAFLLACTAAISFFMPMRFVSLNAVFMAQLEAVGESKAGWYRGTHMIGMFLLGPVVAAAAVRGVGYSGTYWMIAALFFLTVFVSPIVFRGYTPRPEQRRRLSFAELLAQLRLLRHEPELRSACLLEACGQGINGFYVFFIVAIALQTLGMSAAEATQLITAQGISFIVALFLLGGLVSRLGHARAYPASFALVAVSLGLLGSTQLRPLLLLAALLLGLGLGGIQIMNLTRFARIGAQLGRGKVAALNALAGPAGTFFGSLAGGALGQLIGLRTVFLVCSAAAAVLFVGALQKLLATRSASEPA
ncbi:MFS transporter [Uliginosibacterium sp. H1]|uniref:MFS transporter n=1 Tax=Uliginosibacterium sp. H1 TaxID=3114757 RepID=UPI002E17AA1F|nr:MFS transporter [Uliginosibacterium sp. H1]